MTVSYQTVVSRYRESEVLSASPARLLIITFDFLLAQMTRAKVGIESGRRDVTTPALDKAREAVAELLASVDPTHNTELGHRLVSLYAYILAQLVEQVGSPDVSRLAELTRLVRELRDAFAAAGERPTHAEVA